VNSFIQLNDDELTIIYGGDSLFYDIGKFVGNKVGTIYKEVKNLWEKVEELFDPAPKGIPVNNVYMC